MLLGSSPSPRDSSSASMLGYQAVAGLLMVGTIAGVLLATVSTTAAAPGDNAKKYIENHGPLTDCRRESVAQARPMLRPFVGDTVGDPFQGHQPSSLHVSGEAAGHHHPGDGPALHPLGEPLRGPAVFRPPVRAHSVPRSPPRPTRSLRDRDIRTEGDIAWTLSIQALIIGPCSGSDRVHPRLQLRHLILVPWAMGWTDPSSTRWRSTSCSTMGTLLALILYSCATG